MLSASILLVATSSGCDMQQDRSTGWRLGTPRVMQFRYQVIGIVLGAVIRVVLAKVFMSACPVLTLNTFDHPEAKVGQWQSAMTFQFGGAVKDIGHLLGYEVTAMAIGLAIGLATEILRKLVLRRPGYRSFVDGSKLGFAVGWTVDAILLSSPYASSFGGFVDLTTCVRWSAGGVLSSLCDSVQKQRAARRPATGEEGLPEDMSTTSPAWQGGEGMKRAEGQRPNTGAVLLLLAGAIAEVGCGSSATPDQGRDMAADLATPIDSSPTPRRPTSSPTPRRPTSSPGPRRGAAMAGGVQE